VEEINTTGTVAITNNETGKAIPHAGPRQPFGRTEESKLVFNKYGDRYFLSELWFAGKDVGDCISRGKLEREVSKAPAASCNCRHALGGKEDTPDS